MDTPYQTAGSFFSETSTRSTARRLRRTRQHLGSYRHDLIVAMRVVNNVEREMIRAEWENWLLDENTRCKQMSTMLRDTRSSPSSDKLKVADARASADKKEKEALRIWQVEYCGSCQREQEQLLAGRKNLAFG